MKITIEMDEVEKEKFNKMCDQVERLEIELCGGRMTNGFVKDMRTDFREHKIEDAENFKKMFEHLDTLDRYKTKTQLFAGWSWKAIGIMGGFIMAVCGLIQFLIEIIFK